MSLLYQLAISNGNLYHAVDLFNEEMFRGDNILGICDGPAYLACKAANTETYLYNKETAKYMLLYYNQHVVPSRLDQIHLF